MVKKERRIYCEDDGDDCCSGRLWYRPTTLPFLDSIPIIHTVFRIGPEGRTGKTENQIEIRFFKHKEPDICGNFMNP